MPVALEVLVGPPDADALEAAWRTLWANLRWLPVGRVEMETARRLLFDLAATTAGAHRRSAIGYTVAACAASADGVTVWHWDRDLTVICDHAGIAHEPEHDRAAERGLGVEPRDQARRRT